MLFSSFVFLYLFLPLTVGLYLLCPRSGKNLFLLLASLFFYAWGEPGFLVAMLLSIVWNFLWGLALKPDAGKSSVKRRWGLGIALLGNLGLLFYYKYFLFVAGVVAEMLRLEEVEALKMLNIYLPIGISFFTFQGISYLVDVYRGEVPPQRKFIDLALYIALFPQLIAGPIVRYSTIAEELRLPRRVTSNEFAAGLRQFIFGLGAKVILANPAGQLADRIFALPQAELTCTAAWLGALAYALQIYYDFAGYSNMAIGLGRLFGFHFPVNFNFPYAASSITDFWRRWHMSLSAWFRDYVYIPLGGNRAGRWKTIRNLFLVFLMTGIWHGANWTFLVWGLWHGILLIVEKTGFPTHLPGWMMRSWTLLAVLVGWVFFRSNNLTEAAGYLRCMFFPGVNPETVNAVPAPWTHSGLFWLVIALLLAFPWCRKITIKPYWSEILSIGVLLLSLTMLARFTYNPFLYFRF